MDSAAAVVHSQTPLHRIADRTPWSAPALRFDRPAFARHSTFHPRFGWLKKGFDLAREDPSVFSRDDAPVVLGVGKNMVRAIRHWCLATGVLAKGDLAGMVVPTQFGGDLLGPDGLDPFLEDLGSLWLLHWRLLAHPEHATGWWFAFYRFNRAEFELDELFRALQEFAEREFPTGRFASSSFKKDTACILRMYGELPSGSLSEESIHCPFAELGLLQRVGRRAYAFRVGTKPGLSSEIVVAAALEFASAVGEGARTISLGLLLRAAGGPGLAFRVGESGLVAALEEIVQAEPTLGLADAGGIVQLSFDEDPRLVANRLVRRHYERSLLGVV